jgi:hypothetical protein
MGDIDMRSLGFGQCQACREQHTDRYGTNRLDHLYAHCTTSLVFMSDDLPVHTNVTAPMGKMVAQTLQVLPASILTILFAMSYQFNLRENWIWREFSAELIRPKFEVP